MNLEPLLDPSVSARLCLTLAHSFWQLTLLAALAWGLDRLWRRSMTRRYAVHVFALAAGLAALPATYLLVDVGETPQGPKSTNPFAQLLVDSTPAVATTPVILAGPTTSTDPQPIVPPPAVETPRPSSVADVSAPLTQASGQPSARWLVLAPWIIALYALGVAGMLLRLVLATLRANRLATDSAPLIDGPLVGTVRTYAQRWSMRVVPALAHLERIAVPKVVGLLRPTILLPSAAVTGLSPDQMEMILVHELTHLRRHDLWVNLLQRIAEAVLFFNPALWYLSRRISTLREYCCDELTCQTLAEAAPEPRRDYAVALLRIAELSQEKTKPHPNRRSPEPSELATLAATGRSPSELRRRVAYLFGEPIREPLRITRGGLTVVLSGIALALGLLVWETQAQLSAKKADTENHVDDTTREFRLMVLGPDGNPVADAQVDVRTRPKLTAEQVRRGTFVRQHNYGSYAKTDADGRLEVTFSERPQRFSVWITEAGYGPYWAQWDSGNHPEALPREFTARLDAGWAVGGVVVDETGAPVEGVQVKPGIKYKKRPGDTGQLGVGTRIKTDADGTWRFDSVPVSKSDVHVEVSHPDFQPLRTRLPRDGFELTADAEPVARLTLNRGLTVTGKVTDESGAPIVGALVRTKFHNDLREAKSDEEGSYRLPGCEPRMAKIVVSATGRATDMQEVRVDPDMQPVNFTMKPGGKLRIRVVDEQGKGIPKARIFFQRWRGLFDYFEFDHVNQYADENGIWEWNEAPLDEFKADICRPGGMQLTKQPLIAREEEYVFTPPKALVVTGSVVDAKTGEPIKTFRVIPGLRNDPSIGFNWIQGDSYEATDAAYRVRFRHSSASGVHVVRIEADSYKVAISRDIQMDEGNVELDFELEPAEDIVATVLTAAGERAAGAQIALGVAGSQISIENGRIDDVSTYAMRLNADEEGRIRLPARDEPFQIVVLHPQGFAHVKADDGSIPERITLTRWARVEGTFRVGADPAPNVLLSLHAEGIHSYGNDVPNIFTHHDVRTDEGGRFVFDRVFPGEGRIGRRITMMVDDGATEVTSSVRMSAEFVAGETTTLDLGGTGRPVIGKFDPPPGHDGKVHWNFAQINVQPDLTPPESPTPPADAQNDPEKRNAWWEAWKRTDEGKTWTSAYESFEQLRDAAPYITATVDRDGSFRIDDVPAGVYLLSVRFDKHSPGTLSDHFFLVTPVEAGRAAEPLDLGMLTLARQ